MSIYLCDRVANNPPLLFLLGKLLVSICYVLSFFIIPFFQYQEDDPPVITCAIYLTSFGRLVCGQMDGSIAVLSATQAATVLMLQPGKFSRGTLNVSYT